MKYYMWIKTKEEHFLKVAVTNNYESIKECFEKIMIGGFFKEVMLFDENGKLLNMKN